MFLHCLFSVHPCDKADKGGCSDKCEKNGKDAECKCNDPTTHELDSNGKLCVESK